MNRTGLPTVKAARVPLRITLVALLVVLVAVGLGATGIAATSLLRNYLLERQDADLYQALHDAQRNPALIDLCLRQPTRRLPAPPTTPASRRTGIPSSCRARPIPTEPSRRWNGRTAR